MFPNDTFERNSGNCRTTNVRKSKYVQPINKSERPMIDLENKNKSTFADVLPMTCSPLKDMMKESIGEGFVCLNQFICLFLNEKWGFLKCIKVYLKCMSKIFFSSDTPQIFSILYVAALTFLEELVIIVAMLRFLKSVPSSLF